MNEQRSFTTMTTGCLNCPRSEPVPFSYSKTCNMASTIAEAQRLFHENVQGITDSCPMAAQHKRDETRRDEMKYLLLALILSGCEMKVGDAPRACTTEQFTMMSKYTEQCERGYQKGYCFDKAQEAYCEEKTK